MYSGSVRSVLSFSDPEAYRQPALLNSVADTGALAGKQLDAEFARRLLEDLLPYIRSHH